MSSRLRGPSAKDTPRAASFTKDHFHRSESEVRSGRSCKNSERDNRYHFGMSKQHDNKVERNGWEYNKNAQIEEDNADLMYKKSREHFGSWDIKDIVQDTRKSKKQDLEDTQLTNGKFKSEPVGAKLDKSLDRSEYRDEGYVGSLPREGRQRGESVEKELNSSHKSTIKESWEEIESRNRGRRSKISRNNDSNTDSMQPVDERDILLKEIENLATDGSQSPDRRIQAMIERLKSREESKLRFKREQRSASPEKEAHSTTKSDSRSDLRSSVIDHPLDNLSNNQGRKLKDEGDEPRRSSESKLRGKPDQKVDVGRRDRSTDRKSRSTERRNETREPRRDSFRKTNDIYNAERNYRRKSIEDEENHFCSRDNSSKTRSYTYEGSPENFDVRIQKYDRAILEPRRDLDRRSPRRSSPRRSSSKETNLVRKESLKEYDREPITKKNSFKAESKRATSKDHGESNLIRKTSFKDQDNDLYKRHLSKNQHETSIRYFAKDQEDLSCKDSFKDANTDVHKNVFKIRDNEFDRTFLKDQSDNTERKVAMEQASGVSRIVLRNIDDESSRNNLFKNANANFGKKNSFKEKNIESSEISYKDCENNLERRKNSLKDDDKEFGRMSYHDYENNIDRKTANNRYIEFGKISFKTQDDELCISSPFKEENNEAIVRTNSFKEHDASSKRRASLRSRDREMLEKSDRHLRALSPPKKDELESNAKDSKNFCAKSWYENNRMFSAKYLRDHSKQRSTPEGRLDVEVSPERGFSILQDTRGSTVVTATNDPEENRFETRGKIDSGDSESLRFSSARDCNGATIIRIRSSEDSGSAERRRRRRPAQEICAVRRRKYADDDEDSDEDEEEDRWRRTRRDGGILPGRGGDAGSTTPSRTVWNYREGGVLITDMEEGQPCLQCGETCSGFSPHTWRKNCTSCKCPREAHDVCHEEWVSVRSRLGLKGDESNGPIGVDPRERGLAWAPPGLPSHKMEEYFSMLPEIAVPRLGTPGERHRDRQLAIQLPKQDLARAYCRHLDPKHASSADDFMAARNEIALDIGSVQEVLERDLECGVCESSLKYGSLAVSASKLGLFYHPTCFRCTDCKELLVDLAYCVHDDMLFCERHYAEQLKPRCAACDEMGLLLSVLVGCVGVLELLACLRHASDSVVISINPPTPCLSYHEPASNDIQSIHDSLCNFSHSTDVRLPRDAKHKLENLHEYSLRVRSELRSLDRNFDGRSTLSECSTRYLLGGSRPDSRISPDSRLSPEFSYLTREDDETWVVQANRHYNDDNDDYIETKRFLEEINTEIRESLQEVVRSLAPPEPKKYVRIPTPIPFAHEENKISASSSEVDTSFDKDSGNEAPTMISFDDFSIIKRYKDSQSASSVDESDHEERKITRRTLRKSSSKSPDLSKKTKNVDISKKMKKLSHDLTRIDSPVHLAVEKNEIEKKTFVSQKKPKSGKSSTTILRKPTRLKSKNAEISKSAENLSTKKSKKNHDPERRKSDISVQTVRDLLKDMSTNTSPTNSPSLSRSESKKSVSVEVQTVLEDILLDDDALEELISNVIGLSESRRDLSSRGNSAKKSFKNKRFRSNSRDQSDDQDKQIYTATNAVASVERLRRDKTKALKVSRFEDANEEDYEKIKDVIFDSSKEPNIWKRRENSRSKSSFEEDDDEFVDAEDVSSGKPPIQYTTPDTDQNKAFWLIFSGEYTKAMNKDWHSGHFCCWQCDESLTGQRYVLRDEHPYCIKCYESVFANGCEECNKIIGIDSKDLSYKDKHWHEACFLCNRCRVSLVDKQFGSKVDKIYCGNCYDAQFASRCDGCGEIFRAGTKKMEYKTRQWHEKCFCCVVCKNPIGTKSFIPREQEIYCAGCYEDKFATRCVKCNKIITSGGVTYKNEPWHRDCFTCSNCNNSLAGQRFTSRDDKPYCADCFGELFAKRCTACSKPITGIGGTRFISFEDRHWHNDCFICAGCKTSLVGRGFITDGDDIICPECAKMKLM